MKQIDHARISIFIISRLLVSAITVTEVNALSVICRAKHVLDPEGINASHVQEAGNWRPVNAIRNVRKDSLSRISAVKSVTITVALVKVIVIDCY